MARVTGLEPATSGVTGRRSDQLSYTRARAGDIAVEFGGRKPLSFIHVNRQSGVSLNRVLRHCLREAVVADIVNLNKARKARAKAEAEETASANRVRFGRTRQEKEAARQEAERRTRDLEGKKLEE
jgi:hypothetical protein